MLFTNLKKILILTGAVSLVTLSAILPADAQDSSAILVQIRQRLDDLPAALVKLGTFIDAWMNGDTSKIAVNTQTNFVKLNDLLTSTKTGQIDMQVSLNKLMLSNDGNNLNAMNFGKPPTGETPTAQTFGYANDLAYSTVLGTPLFKDNRKNTNPVLNYIMNASGMNLYHPMPQPSWQPNKGSTSLQRYKSYYNTIMAATSYNNYILSYNAVDKNQFNTLQTQLIQQASDTKDWFAEVSSESIGYVMRQILLYQSQIFLLLTESLQTQKQIASAVAMNTAVLIAINNTNESVAVAYAQGEQPTL